MSTFRTDHGEFQREIIIVRITTIRFLSNFGASAEPGASQLLENTSARAAPEKLNKPRRKHPHFGRPNPSARQSPSLAEHGHEPW
ncbi:hypothetical protein MTP99_011593 [Tenebrio molitor]|jgi:hypothetical protein|nr:hypothetical protein MTP99_011593 [Tenebrio molitor]